MNYRSALALFSMYIILERLKFASPEIRFRAEHGQDLLLQFFRYQTWGKISNG